MLQTIRMLLMYFLLVSLTLLWCLPSVLLGVFLPYRLRYKVIAGSWTTVAIWIIKHVTKIDYRVTGVENIPQQPCVILAKHQSTWETFFLSNYFQPLSQVLKQELLRIPVFGWALKMVKPIALDRSQPKQALKQLAEQGRTALEHGNWLLIFPEGTRVPPGKIGKFSRGGASLAAKAGLPVVPVAHNAGHLWPKDGWAKKPGVIDVVIGPPMLANGTDGAAIAELNERAYRWIAKAQREIGSLDDESWAQFVPESGNEPLE